MSDINQQPTLVNVYLVEGLKSNLISVSQLCDEGLMVMFTRTECKVVDEEEKVVLFGIRTVSNCYMWRAMETVETVQLISDGQDSSHWQKCMDEEILEFAASKV